MKNNIEQVSNTLRIRSVPWDDRNPNDKIRLYPVETLVNNVWVLTHLADYLWYARMVIKEIISGRRELENMGIFRGSN